MKTMIARTASAALMFGSLLLLGAAVYGPPGIRR